MFSVEPFSETDTPLFNYFFTPVYDPFQINPPLTINGTLMGYLLSGCVVFGQDNLNFWIRFYATNQMSGCVKLKLTDPPFHSQTPDPLLQQSLSVTVATLLHHISQNGH